MDTNFVLVVDDPIIQIRLTSHQFMPAPGRKNVWLIACEWGDKHMRLVVGPTLKTKLEAILKTSKVPPIISLKTVSDNPLAYDIQIVNSQPAL